MTIESVNTDKETAQLNVMKVIWLGLLFYSGVLVYVAFNVLTPKEIVESPLETPFLMLAVGILIAGRMIPKLLNKNFKHIQKLNDNVKTLKAYFVGFVIALSLSESVVMLGFVLVIVTGNPKRILPFALAGIINILMLYPRKEIILGASERIT